MTEPQVAHWSPPGLSGHRQAIRFVVVDGSRQLSLKGVSRPTVIPPVKSAGGFSDEVSSADDDHQEHHRSEVSLSTSL